MSEKPKLGVVINMAEHAPAPIPDDVANVLNALKSYLDNGLVAGIAIAIVPPPDADCEFDCMTSYATGGNRVLIVGAIEMLRDRVIKEATQA